jgi:hypothetical protein
MFILERKVVSLRKDMEDQLKEVEKEKWYRGEKNECDDFDCVCKEWVKNYGGAWRVHRTREVLYVFEREKERYLEVIENGHTS